MHAQKALEMSKLVQGKVRRSRSLIALFAVYAHTHVGFLNHTHVIRTVTDGKTDFLGSLLDEANHLGLLKGRDTIANN